MATHSSTLVWKMTWAAEPGRLHPKGYKESDMTEHMHTHTHTHTHKQARAHTHTHTHTETSTRTHTHTHTHIHTHRALRLSQAVKKFNLVHWKRRVQLEDKEGAPASSQPGEVGHLGPSSPSRVAR